MTLRRAMEDAWEILQEQYIEFAPAVSDVLDLARFDSDKIHLQETEFSLAGLLEDRAKSESQRQKVQTGLTERHDNLYPRAHVAF